ncbi:MAG: ribonuclease HII [Alphaproteobacteria bacterium]|nr:ribonuclease HII [Alphaproteobacteria bacterium]
MPNFAIEDTFEGLVVGIDEAGRGPLAGPVVAAAVIFDRARVPRALRRTLDDSKALPPAVREVLFDQLHEIQDQGVARIGVGSASVAEIDSINILQATLLAMARAVEALGETPAIALVDGNRPPRLSCPVHTVVGGDGLSLSIAAASVVAKVTRDRQMTELAREHPGFGWERNAGYGTPEHHAALERFGPTPHHRRSFAPVARFFAATLDVVVVESRLPK